MEILLASIPFIPFAGFLILAFAGRRMTEKAVAVTGAGSVGLTSLLVIVLGILFFQNDRMPVEITLWDWISEAGMQIPFALRLDSLSMVFIFIITFVGFLIHVYSAAFMKDDEGYSRFFAYMNLFVSSMLMLVLGSNLLLLYLGWEGVGVCSYLLIGFWYRDPENTKSANKAFIITRIGDTAMIIGLFLLFLQLGTLNIQELMQEASLQWPVNSQMANWAAVLLLGGALGKSAQLPLQTWLPDAMAGPSPVSALIHAATMVTAGVYLIARTNVLFMLAPPVMTAVAVIGALTLLVAGFSALTQHDLKRILAYSTISQIGYMFLALGVGAWSAGIFHFFTHAFFKALLFLAGGAVILVLHEEHDIFRMGGLRKSLPLIFRTFIAGAASLAALPLVTAGFFSKDEIIWYSLSAENGNVLLYIIAAAGALLTSLYTFRLVFVVFYGEEKIRPHFLPGKSMTVPLIILAIFSVIAGYIQLPGNWGSVHLFSDFLENALPPTYEKAMVLPEILFQAIGAVLSLLGIWLAYFYFLKKPEIASSFNKNPLNHFFYKGWGFDALYNTLIVRPVIYLAELNKRDFVDLLSRGIALLSLFFNYQLSYFQNGKIRWYVMAFAVGIIFILSIMMNV